MSLFNRKPPSAQPMRVLSYQVANLQKQGRRERQEDAFAFVNPNDVEEIRKNGLLAVVADGMGGMKDGQLASGIVTTSLRKDFEKLDRSGDLNEQLKGCVLDADIRVALRLEGGGGSTVVACLFYDERLYYCSVGDSALYLFRSGVLTRVNREHNLLNDRYLETIRSFETDPAEARADPEAQALTQFLGKRDSLEVDCFRRPLRLYDGDVLLLCTDGVSGVLSEGELAACLSAPGAPEMCDRLDRAVTRIGSPYQDNYTALVIKCEL